MRVVERSAAQYFTLITPNSKQLTVFLLLLLSFLLFLLSIFMLYSIAPESDYVQPIISNQLDHGAVSMLK